MLNSLQCSMASFVFFSVFERKISPYLSNSIPKYRKLTLEQKSEWNARNSSTVHATTVTLICIYVLLFEDKIKKDMVWGYSKIAEANIAIAVGYLFSDLILIFTNAEAVGGDWGFVVHHLASIYAYLFCLNHGLLQYFANFRLIAEMSTPFVNLRWTLSVCGMKDGNVYFKNGLVMTATFFLSRIIVMPYYYYMVHYTVHMDNYASVSQLIHYSWIGVCIVLDIMNIYWFRKMLTGVLKHFSFSSNTCKQSNVPVGNGCLIQTDKSD